MKASIVYEQIFSYDAQNEVKSGTAVKVIDRKNERIMTLNDLPYETVTKIFDEISEECLKPIGAMSNRYEFYMQKVVEYDGAEDKQNVVL